MSLSNGSTNAVPKPFEGIWEGESKIVIGIDIGTTQSGVAFAFLEQEALSHQAEEDAEDQGWRLAKHFKLHMHPSDMKAKHKLKMDDLPAGVPLRRIYSDFMGYLLGHTRSFFEERVVDGPLIWEKHHPQMEVIIAHPNGWGIREQTFLRDAAVDAGFASSASSHKIRFVTEAEASVHFCINRTNLGNCLQVGTKFAVCDAGGSTVDTTVYSVVAVRPMLKLEETRASACVQAGAIYVDAAAREHLKRVLTDESKKDPPKKDGAVSVEDIEEYTARGVKDFEMVAKRTFRDATEEKAIEIAGTRFNNPSIKIRRGRMTVPGTVIKSFFDICVNEITTSVDQQIKGTEVSYMLLVGGFGDSLFLRQAFKNRYEPQGCQVTLTNDSTSKAVAEGAVIWNAVSSVIGRAPRLSFGIEVAVPNDPMSTEFRGRQVYTCPSAYLQDIVIDADAVNRRSFSAPSSSPYPDLDDFEVTLLSYSKPGQPKWARAKKGQYPELDPYVIC
ncbi:hypothetical protein FRC10_007911 [Ceratobasidium sp. 414]|nr:hypothetical protein FRC10_007911 [Ceratobasidium sp. 414]